MYFKLDMFLSICDNSYVANYFWVFNNIRFSNMRDLFKLTVQLQKYVCFKKNNNQNLFQKPQNCLEFKNVASKKIKKECNVDATFLTNTRSKIGTGNIESGKMFETGTNVLSKFSLLL